MRLLFVSVCLLVSVISWGQFTVIGNVADELGNPLTGATIQLDDGQKSAITDLDGNYSLYNVSNGEHIIRFDYLGFEQVEQKIIVSNDYSFDLKMTQAQIALDEVNIVANRLDKSSPFSYIELSSEEIGLKNLGQDIPFLLEHTPSMVVTSDAGAGIGYTGMRIRGTDATRINVTINGVPLNDSESQGVFWVNLPDFGSSVQNVQIQRGVGTSTHGAASFGATVALDTDKVSQKAFGKIGLGLGSYNTLRLSGEGGSGIINDKFFVEGRYSLIKSDGYIDRASSDLNSWFVSAGMIDDNSSLRLNVFSGNERTYQAWWGTPQNLLESDRQYNYYTYENEVDDYGQDHFQLVYHLKPNTNFRLNTTAHYTKGKGFFEQFREQDDLLDYGIGTTDETSNLVRRRWLDNDFFGFISNVEYTLHDRLSLFAGIGFNQYLGDHFGEVIAVDALPDFETKDPYYFSNATKNDFNIYGRVESSLSDKLSFLADLQLRTISYKTAGKDNDLFQFDIDESYTFINPKLGLTYQHNKKDQFYFSVARTNREPVRSDFVDAVGTDVLEHETLTDFELGYRRTSGSYSFEANFYHMLYKNQLVLTGNLNDVGAAIRTNVDNSYRQGLEISLNWQASDKFSWRPNITFARSNIESFEDVVFNYDDGSILRTQISNADISYSPKIIAASTFSFAPYKNLTLSWLTKYVGQQFLDNTSNSARIINPYWVNDLVFSYQLKTKALKNVNFRLAINNVLSEKYESNGYTFSYIFGELITENYYYPQAERNLLMGVEVKF